MEDSTQKLIQTLPDTYLALFATRLHDWLIADLNQADEDVPDFTESRAKALLRAANVVDDPTLHSFSRLVENETAVRLALYDLLSESGLAEDEEVAALITTSAASSATEPQPVPWLSLSIAAICRLLSVMMSFSRCASCSK